MSCCIGQKQTNNGKMSLPFYGRDIFTLKFIDWGKLHRRFPHEAVQAAFRPGCPMLPGGGDHRPHLRLPGGDPRRAVRRPARLPRRRPRPYPRGPVPGRGRRGVRPAPARRCSGRPGGRPADRPGSAGGGILRPPRRRPFPHRRHRHQGQDHHRSYDPGYPVRRRIQDRHDRHPGGVHRPGKAVRQPQHHPRAHRPPPDPAADGGRRVLLCGAGGVLPGHEAPAPARPHLRRRSVPGPVPGPHRPRRARRPGGVPRLQSRPLPPVPPGGGQHGRSRLAHHGRPAPQGRSRLHLRLPPGGGRARPGHRARPRPPPGPPPHRGGRAPLPHPPARAVQRPGRPGRRGPQP